MLVDVVLPCRDRARALPWVLRRAPEGYRPIVVDTGSTDGSAEIARLFGARVVIELRLRDAGPVRAVRQDELLALAAGRRPDREAQLLGRVAAAGWRIREVAVDYRPKAARALPSRRPPAHGLPPDIPVWH